MRTALQYFPGRRRRRQGMAVIVVIALLAIISIYVAANVRTLHYLKRNVSLVEQKQLRRLQAHDRAASHAAAMAGLPVVSGAATNAAPPHEHD